MLTQGEEEVIRNVLKRLRCAPRPDGAPRETEQVRAALLSPEAKIYLDSWVIAALECLLPECRDVTLARALSK